MMRFPGPHIAAFLMLCCAAAGCGGPRGVATVPFAALSGVAAADSLGLESFLALTSAERAARRTEAASYLDAARAAATNRAYTRALQRAAGLAPDDPTPWLDLAHTWRWVGDYLHAETCLDNATAALRAWGAPGADAPEDRIGRNEAALRTTLLRAWLAYDRAEWREGLVWARAAADRKASKEEAWRLEGLLSGALGRHADAHQAAADLLRRDPFSSDAVWILAELAWGRGENHAAFDRLVHVQPGQGTVAELRPARENAAACYRDMGAIAEVVGEWGYARRWYAESAAALPLPHTDGIARSRLPAWGLPTAGSSCRSGWPRAAPTSPAPWRPTRTWPTGVSRRPAPGRTGSCGRGPWSTPRASCCAGTRPPPGPSARGGWCSPAWARPTGDWPTCSAPPNGWNRTAKSMPRWRRPWATCSW